MYVCFKQHAMKFIAQLILFCLTAYLLISAVGFWGVMFGLLVMALVSLSK
jgi:hypothetical protein